MPGVIASEIDLVGESCSMKPSLPAPLHCAGLAQQAAPADENLDTHPVSAEFHYSLKSLEYVAERRTVPSWLERAARDTLFTQLKKMREGCIEIVDGDERHRFGASGATPAECIPAMIVHSPRLFPRTVLGGLIGAAESYMDGEWTCTDLTALIRVFIQNLDTRTRLNSGLARLTRPLLRLGHWLRGNSLSGSRKNTAAHYDLSNDFFALFLDETMMYSSAFFERNDMSLVEASTAKNDRLCQMLQLSPHDHLLEIGTGWGGFAIHAAAQYGCRVTTTTISKKQFALATERVAQAGLSAKITVLQKDYRLLDGQYDKMVSIEMIEAVGRDYLDGFFKRCGELLKPHGAMALQAITIQDRFFEQHARSVDFIKKHIFPGSCLPSIARMLDATRKYTDMNLVRLDEITPHYARTLKAWRERFVEKRDWVRAMGFGEKFIRMWEFYLCYCEAGFAERHIGTVQMLLTKPGWRV